MAQGPYVVFPALSLRCCQHVCTIRKRVTHTVQGRGAWHAVTFPSALRPINMPSSLFTLFMRPSEDKTSQTMMVYQHMFYDFRYHSAGGRCWSLAVVNAAALVIVCLAGLSASQRPSDGADDPTSVFGSWRRFMSRREIIVRRVLGRRRKEEGYQNLHLSRGQ